METVRLAEEQLIEIHRLLLRVGELRGEATLRLDRTTSSWSGR